jgi:hypothetical protein
MSEPTIKIKADRTQRIFVLQDETLIVTPERAEALAGFVTVVTPAAPEPEDRMVRGKTKRP